jgi:hypothetical protein
VGPAGIGTFSRRGEVGRRIASWPGGPPGPRDAWRERHEPAARRRGRPGPGAGGDHGDRGRSGRPGHRLPPRPARPGGGVPGDHRRAVVPVRQRGRRLGHVRPGAVRSRLRRRARPRHPAAALQRLQEPGPAAARRRAGGGGVPFGRRHRLRGGPGRPSDRAQRPDPRRGALRHRGPAGAADLPGHVLPGQARADHQDAPRPQAASRGQAPRRTADPGQAGRPHRGRGGAGGGADDRGPRRSPGAR